MLCEKMGWTYQELLNQPEDFITAGCDYERIKNQWQKQI